VVVMMHFTCMTGREMVQPAVFLPRFVLSFVLSLFLLSVCSFFSALFGAV
jgi:hypothetical protein